MNPSVLRSIHCAAAIALLALLYPSTADAAGWTFISVKSTIGGQPGATGNGTTDDTLAINRAISLGGNAVYFPPGIYRYVGQMTLPVANRSYRFYGDGPGVSIIAFEGTPTGINAPSLGRETFNVEGLTLKANTANCGIAIDAVFGPHASPTPANTKFRTASIHNVQILGSAKDENTPGYWTTGIRLYRGQNSVVDKVEISGRKNLTQTGILFENAASGENSTGFQVSDIAVKWCNSGLVMNGYLEGLYMTGFNFFSCGRAGIPAISLNGAPGTVSGAFQLVNGFVDSVGSGLHMTNFELAKVSNVSFKHNPGSEINPDGTLLFLNGIKRAVVSDCSFYGTDVNGPWENGLLVGGDSFAVQISGNYFTNMQSLHAGNAIGIYAPPLGNVSLVRITDNLFTSTVSSRFYDGAYLHDTYYCGNSPTNNCGVNNP